MGRVLCALSSDTSTTMPGVTVEDEVGRLMLRGYRLVRRSDDEALLAQPRTASAGEAALLVFGLVLGVAGIYLGVSSAQTWTLAIGAGVIAVSIVLYALRRRAVGVRVFLDKSGEVRLERVRGAHW